MFKEFLNLNEVAEIFNSNGYNFDLLIQTNKLNLIEILADLAKEGMIDPVFYYEGNFDKFEVKYGLINNFNPQTSDEDLQPIALSRVPYHSNLKHNYCYILDTQFISKVFKNPTQSFSLKGVYLHPVLVESFENILNKQERSTYIQFEFKPIENEQLINVDDFRYSINSILALFQKPSYEQISERLGNGIKAYKQLLAEFNELTNQRDNYLGKIEELENKICQLEEQSDTSKSTTNGSTNNEELKGLHKYNYDKEKAQKFAYIVAKSIWKMDSEELIRVSDMVQFIKTLLLEFDEKSLPENDATISNWIKEIKPEYAKKAGRNPKSSPLEIPLIFKK